MSHTRTHAHTHTHTHSNTHTHTHTQIVAIGPHKEGTMIDWIAPQDICSVTCGLDAGIHQFGVCVCACVCVCDDDDDDDVLFIGTRFSNLYTAVDTPA
jgi:hypothetical protein